MADFIRMKAVMVGDVNVLKVHFLLQTDGLYKRDHANSYSLYMENHQVDLNVYDKVVNVVVWNSIVCSR